MSWDRQSTNKMVGQWKCSMSGLIIIFNNVNFNLPCNCPYSSLLRLFGREENKEEKKKNLS